MTFKLLLHQWWKHLSTTDVVALRRIIGPPMVVRRKIPPRLAHSELTGITVRVNPPAQHARTCVHRNTVCDLLHIKRKIVCPRNLRLTSGLTPDEAQSDVSQVVLGACIASVSTAAVVPSRHDQCPANTTVGTKRTDTVAVAVKADDKSDTT